MNIKKIIREEMDDWDWAREAVLLNMEDFNLGDKIRVHNVGSEEAFLEWLGLYADNYKRGKYGKNIEGTITHIISNQSEVTIDTDQIFFPKSRHMEELSNKDRYRGLDIKYELI